MDKIKKVTGTEDDYNDMYVNDMYDDYDSYGGDSMDDGAASSQPYSYSQPTSASSSFSSQSGLSIGGNALEMKVVKPEQYESVPQIADHLLNHRTVVLNLENTNKETARRLIDFLSGVAYSIDGALKKIASNAYVITPSNVDIGDAMLKSGVAQEAKAEEEPAPAVNTNFGGFGEI